MHHGLFVDIFVLDDYVQNKFLRTLTEYITMFDYNASRRYLPEGKQKIVYRLTNRLFAGEKLFRFWYKHVFPHLKKDPTTVLRHRLLHPLGPVRLQAGMAGDPAVRPLRQLFLPDPGGRGQMPHRLLRRLY